jgi:hypothetical protein
MTSKEIQLIIKQAVQEAREETKKEIYHQIKIITDIDPASDEGLHKLRDVFNWAKSGNDNCEKTWEIAKEIVVKSIIIGFMTVVGYGIAIAIKRISES